MMDLPTHYNCVLWYTKHEYKKERIGISPCHTCEYISGTSEQPSGMGNVLFVFSHTHKNVKN